MKLQDSTSAQTGSAEHTEFLLSLTAQGSGEALAALYEQTRISVFSYLLSYLNWHDAQDAMQETFLAVYESSKNYQAKGTPLAWILGIARNTALMKLRGANRETVRPQEYWDEIQVQMPEAAIEDRQILQHLLQKLTPEEYRIVVFHAVSGLKFREISTILSLPLSTVLSKYSRSMKKLKKAWGEEVHDA